MDSKELLQKLNQKLFNSEFKIKRKNLLLKIFVPKGYIITIFNSIYVENSTDISISTLLHESQHYIDRMVYKDGKFYRNYIKELMFYIKYLSPQILGVFSLFSLFSIWFTNFFLLFLILIFFFFPNPKLSFFRRDYELKGYYWNWYFNESYNYSKIFNSWEYYKMDSYHSQEYYHEIFSNMKSSKLKEFYERDIK